MYSTSLAGHIDSGESSNQAFYREIREELGLNPVRMKIEFLFSFRRFVTIDSTYIDNQFNDIYEPIPVIDPSKKLSSRMSKNLSSNAFFSPSAQLAA